MDWKQLYIGVFSCGRVSTILIWIVTLIYDIKKWQIWKMSTNMRLQLPWLSWLWLVHLRVLPLRISTEHPFSFKDWISTLNVLVTSMAFSSIYDCLLKLKLYRELCIKLAGLTHVLTGIVFLRYFYPLEVVGRSIKRQHHMSEKYE